MLQGCFLSFPPPFFSMAASLFYFILLKKKEKKTRKTLVASLYIYGCFAPSLFGCCFSSSGFWSVGRSVGRGGVTDDDDDDDDSLPFHFIPFDLADTHTKKEKKKIYIEESYTPYGSPALKKKNQDEFHRRSI